MIDEVIAGRRRGVPTLRTAANGRTFATFRISAADHPGAYVLVSCVAFSASAIESMQRLEEGDSFLATGETALSTWNGSNGTICYGLSVTVHRVLSVYHAVRKQQNHDECGDGDKGK